MPERPLLAIKSFPVSEENQKKFDRFTLPVYEVAFNNWENQSFVISLTKVVPPHSVPFTECGDSFQTEIELPGGTVIQFELTLTSPIRDV
jgi:hypothetical protein